MPTTHQLISQYYEFFNQGDMNGLLTLLHDNVIHDINQGETQLGKNEFAKFMQRMNRCYKENVRAVTIMVSDDGQSAAAEFIVDGSYISTDAGLPEAAGQSYSLSCGAFFAVEEGKIIRVTNYYNLNEWIKQVGV